MRCFRVLVSDFRGNLWTPIIVAKDEEGVMRKVENIYPTGTVVECFVIHETHTQWSIVYPAGPLVGAISGGPA